MKAGLSGVKPMLVSLGVLLLGFLFLLPERCTVNMAFLRQDTPAPAELRERIKLPPGFSIAVYASDLPGVRVLRFTEAKDLLASLPEAGSIMLLERDRNGDGRPDGRRELLGGLRRPHGIEVFEDTLYVAETDAVGRARFDAGSGQTVGEYRRVVQGLPAGGNHWSRSVRFGPDGLMYVTVGSSCNVCIEDHPWRAAMLRFRADGSGAEVYATGLRNTVAFDWRPGVGGPGGVASSTAPTSVAISWVTMSRPTSSTTSSAAVFTAGPTPMATGSRTPISARQMLIASPAV
jgi:hypothetical protein